MTLLPNIEKILRGATEAGDLPGVVALAATRAGPAYQGAAGKRALPAGPHMTVDSVFWIASMTKAVISTAAMQLVERGKLQLDQPISEVLPELASPQVLPMEPIDRARARNQYPRSNTALQRLCRIRATPLR
jgi:CubicO group peptidase (beta-lactamase class C family)